MTTSESHVVLGDGLQALLRVEPAAQHDRRAEQHREREVREAPGVEQRGGDVGRPAAAQRHPRQQRDRGVDAGLVARRALGRAGRARGEDDDPARASRGHGRVGVRSAALDQLLEGRDVASGRRRSRRRPAGRRRRTSGEQLGELVVVDEHGGPLAVEDLDELGACERGVEVEQVGAELGRGDAGVDEAAVVAAP